MFLEKYLNKLKSKNCTELKNDKQNGQVSCREEKSHPRTTLGSIDLDDIDRPMRVVEECMQRLELQHQLHEQERQAKNDSSDTDDSDDTISEDTSYSNKSEEYVLEDATHDNPLMAKGRVSPSMSRPNSLNVTSHSTSTDPSQRTSISIESELDDANLPPVEQVIQDCVSIALNWQSFQNLKGCSCSTPLEPYSTKLHCYACGQIFCIRCIDKRCVIPCHYTKAPRLVCRKCYINITRSNSIDV